MRCSHHIRFRYRSFWIVFAFVILLSLEMGCDVPPEGNEPDVEWVVSSYPSNGDKQVPRLGWMWMELDRRVLSATVDRESVRLDSGISSVFLYLLFEPVSRQILIRQHSGSPLVPMTNYRLSVQNLIDLDGNVQPEPHEVFFRVGRQEGEILIPEPISWELDMAPLFQERCATKGCHSSPAQAAGLDLSSARGIQRTAIGIQTRQLSSGMTSQEGERGARFLTGLPIIDVVGAVGVSANSYLMYKVMADSHILGQPMPPPDSGLERLSQDEQLTVSIWILSGAPTKP